MSRLKKLGLTLIATSCLLQVLSMQPSGARVKPIEFHNDLSNHSPTIKPASAITAAHLCPTDDTQQGVSKPNAVSVRDFLGPKLKSITITQVTNFETREKFELAKSAIIELLQKSPKALYRYEPWSNSVAADFVAQIDYSNGKTGELRCTYGYLCVQDADGKHWWMRMMSPDDLNAIPVE